MSTAPRAPRDPLARAADIRATTAARRGSPGVDQGGLGAVSDHVLRRIPLDASDELWAARAVARFTMYRPHGCSGKRCRKPAHEPGREHRDGALDMLGLVDDPSLPGYQPYPGYGPRKRKPVP